ncbi:MAG: LptF/LptG family permease [Elusimicrobiota bacterium]|jgi:lipopolysaccharide export system permease protein|nr:LptF/LptG family permease [Elusimicrobiota bacterium]
MPIIKKTLFRINKIHIYILKEFTASFLFGIAVFSVLLLLERVFDMVDLIFSKGVSIFMMLKLLIVIYPNILPFAIPMSILFGILLSYGRLSEDNEITAMKANCMDYKTMCLPIIIVVSIVSFLLIFFNSFTAPYMQGKVKTIFQDMLTQRPLVSFTEKSVIRLNNYTFYVNKVNRKTNVLEGISIYKFNDDEDSKKENGDTKQIMSSGNITWRISASSASVKIYKTGIQMKLYAGFWQKSNSKNLNNMIHLTFNTFTFFIPLTGKIKEAATSLTEMNSIQLLNKMNELKKIKEPYGKYAVEFWTRLLFATAPLVFALIALPIGIMSGKGGKTIGFGISLAVIAIYYVLLVISMNSSEKNYQYAGFIMWLPNVFIALCGILFMRKMVKK